MPLRSTLSRGLRVLLAIGFFPPSGFASEPWVDRIRGVHPRLYLDEAGVKEIRSRIQLDPIHRDAWERQNAVVRKIKELPPAYREETGEMLWLRGVGDQLGNLAFSWLIGRKVEDLRKADAWAKAICGYPRWGNLKGVFSDLPIGHVYEGLALYLDWCGADGDPATLRLVKATILERGKEYADVLANPESEDYDKLMQNHLWVKASGFAEACWAIVDESPQVLPWLSAVHDRLSRTFDLLPSDGASHEGVGYWQYGFQALARYAWNRRRMTGEDLFRRSWISNTHLYPIYLSTPRSGWKDRNEEEGKESRIPTIVNFSDGPRYNWYGPDTLLRLLARESGAGEAKDFASWLDRAKAECDVSPWQNLVYDDPAVKSSPMKGLPVLHHFGDQGIVSTRDSWEPEAALVALKSGEILGKKATDWIRNAPAEDRAKLVAANAGHVHPDAGTFCLFAEGEWQVPPAGYMQRRTENENVLVVNGTGQLGQDLRQGWWNPTPQISNRRGPTIRVAKSTPEIDLISADPSANYPGIRSWTRHLVFLRSNALVVLDRVRADDPATFTLLFHFERDSDHVRREDDGSFLQEGLTSRLRFLTLADRSSEILAKDQVIPARHGTNNGRMFLVRAKTRSMDWIHAAIYTWSAVVARPALVPLEREGTKVSWETSGKRWRFDFDDPESILKP